MALTKWKYYTYGNDITLQDGVFTIGATAGNYVRCDTGQSDLTDLTINFTMSKDYFVSGGTLFAIVEEVTGGRIVIGVEIYGSSASNFFRVIHTDKSGSIEGVVDTGFGINTGEEVKIKVTKTDSFAFDLSFYMNEILIKEISLAYPQYNLARFPKTSHIIFGNYPDSNITRKVGEMAIDVKNMAIRDSSNNLLVWNNGEVKISGSYEANTFLPKEGEDPEPVEDTSGTITVDKGYYNADGTNIIKFTSPVTKTLTEAANQVEWKNNVFITLDQQDQSSFVVHNDWSPLQGDFKASKKLETTSIYLDSSLKYILGTEPTSIEYHITPQNPGGTYRLEYLTLNGSVSYDETTGKLSGFSTSNYATSSSGITFGSSFDLIFNVTVASASTQQTLFYGQNDSGLLFTDGKIASWFGSNVLGVTSVVNGNTYWIRLVWGGTSYTCYSLLDDGTYTLETLPELSSWTQEFTYSSSTNIFAPGYWIGYHSQATSQYARSTFNMGKAQITTNGVTYRYANGDAEPGSVSFTQGWLYNSTQNRTYQNKNAAPISVGQLKENNAEGAVIGYKNNLGLKFDQSSDVSLPIIASTFGGIYNYNFNQDIYIDNTKTKLLGTTATSESWAEGTTPYTITPGTSATNTGSITYTAGYKYIDETNGSFFIPENTTKTLDELVVGDKAEQMGLYLVIKTDKTTDFVLSSTTPTTDISYTEKVVDVYLDRTLSYIYGTTADPRVKFTIDATPNTATINMVDLVPSSPVQVSGTGTATILVDPSNNLINYGVSAEGYTKKSGTVTATADDTLDVVLEVETFTLTINPTPADATVTLTAEGYTQSGNSITVPSGTSVQWTVSADGYVSQSGEETITEDTTKDITLETEPVTFIINPTPSDATVKINNVVQNSVEVEKGSTVTWSVVKTGYVTQSGEEVVNEDTTKTITLVEEPPRTEVTLPTDTFYAWFRPINMLKYSLTETPGSNDWMYDSLAQDMPSINVGRESSGESGVTFGDRGAIVDGDTFSIGSYSTYTRDTKYDGEFYFCKAWMSDNWESYVTKKEIPESGDVVYSRDVLDTGAITNAGTVGTEWTYDSSAKTLTNSNTTIRQTTDYIWVKASALEENK